MVQFLCLFSLILQDSYEKGECRQLEFWTWKGWNRDSYSAQLQMTWNLWRIILKYIKNTGERINRRGPTRKPQARGARPTPWGHRPGLWGPWQASGPLLLLYEAICPRKNQKKTFGTKRRRLKAEPGQEQFCSPTERFRRGYFPPGGGNRSHWHHQRSSHHGRTNLHQQLHQHHLNPSSSLVFDLCLKTLDWYLWVASSVDYIL